MPNPGDFDPAKAIQDLRQEEENEQQQRDLHRANILKLLRHADEQLEEIRNPVVSEFVLTESWWTPEPKQISDWRDKETFERTLRANQRIISTEDVSGFFRSRYRYTVATRHERQTRYYGSWLSLDCTRSDNLSSYCGGLMKLRQPRAGYANLQLAGSWDPRNVGYLSLSLTNLQGEKLSYPSMHMGSFRICESLEDAAAALHTPEAYRPPDVYHIEQLTTRVKRALDFVATGQPPEPFEIKSDPPGSR